VSGTEYLVSISAVSEYGEGPISSEVVMTAAALPDVPSAPTVSAASNDPSITFSWINPSANGLPVTGYVFSIREDGTAKPEFSVLKDSSSVSVSADGDISMTLTGLTTNLFAVGVGNQYELCVQANTNIGATVCSAYSSLAGFAKGYTLSKPSFGGSATVTRHSDVPVQGTVKITWPMPSNDGGDPGNLSYKVFAVTSLPASPSDEEGLTFTTSNTVQSVTVPAGQKWLFTVQATNRRGEFSTAIGPVALWSCSQPGTPQNVAVSILSQGQGSAAPTLVWSAPSDFGGLASLTGYRVYQDGVAITPDLAEDVLKYAFITGASATAFAVSALSECGEGAQSASYTYSL
jgi:hypothetical protein